MAATNSTATNKGLAVSSGMGMTGMLTKLKWLKQASFYPAEYILMLSTSLGLIFAASFLGAAVISDWLDQPLVQFMSPGVMYLVASVIVTLPVHLAFYWRVRHTDRARISQTALRVAHAALGVYLFIIVSTLVMLATWLVYTGLNLAYGVSDYSDSMLAATLSLVHAMLWLKYSAWHLARARTGRSRPRNYVLVAGVVSIALIATGLIFPGRSGRAAALDSVKEADLSQIESAMSTYVSQKGDLPTSLSQLDLSGGVKDRLSDYDYSPQGSSDYQICATFSGASNDKSFSFSSYTHGAGRECFSRSAYGANSNYLDYNNLNLDSGSSSTDNLNNSLQQYLDSSSLDSL